MPIFDRAAWRGNQNYPGYFPKPTRAVKKIFEEAREKHKKERLKAQAALTDGFSS